MSEGITREDLREALRDMTAEMNRGFDGVNDRLDELNSRTRKAENVIAVHDERWTRNDDRWKRLDHATNLTPPKGMRRPEEEPSDWKPIAKVGALLGGIITGLAYAAGKLYSVLACR
jgi:hypothetical protein